MEVTLFRLVFYNYHWKLARVMNLDFCVPDCLEERRLESKKVIQVLPWMDDLTMDEYTIMQSYIYFVCLVYFGRPHWKSLELCVIIHYNPFKKIKQY